MEKGINKEIAIFVSLTKDLMCYSNSLKLVKFLSP